MMKPPGTTESATVLEMTRRICQQLRIDLRHLTAVEMSYHRGFDHRPSGVTPAYHCAAHGRRVACTFHELAASELDERQLRHGVLAALWHDAAHPGNPNDCVNTLESANVYGTCAPRTTLEDDIDPARIISLIQATQTQLDPADAPSSFLDGDGQLTRTALLLRDADLLQTVIGSDAERWEWVARLAQEVGDPALARLSREDAAGHVVDRLATQPGRSRLGREVRGHDRGGGLLGR